MSSHHQQPRANKTDAGNGSKAVCRVSNVLLSPSPDPRRSAETMNPDYILATGVSDSHKVVSHFASSLVDVAYAQALPDGRVKIEVEPDTNLRDETDLSWILELIRDVFRELRELGVVTEIILTETRSNHAEHVVGGNGG